ncbi:MAG: glycosyltransferase family 2 protein [Candidatus Taylorbacteria bacterium]
MTSWRDITTLSILFLSLYFEVFMLVTYVRRRRLLHGRVKHEPQTHPDLPYVTIIVPCYNEEKTLAATIKSLLALDYPKEKLHIMAVDDGSTDGTFKALQEFADHSQIEILHKENGGKHTVLNMGIARTKSEFVGCLDADSYVNPDALLRIIKRFNDPEVMAVVPSLHIHMPRTPIQKMQKVEYTLGVFWRSILAELNSLYVTPGPFSIFRKSVFDKVGLYHKAHNTEDMEMAMRIQSNGLKIVCANDAVVHTSSPRSVMKLYKQRVRWTSGFLQNLRDYKKLVFNTKTGHLGALVLPIMILSTASIIFIISGWAYDMWRYFHGLIIRFEALGTRMFEWNGFNWHSWNWFFLHTSPIMFGGIVSLVIIIAFILVGAKLSKAKWPRITDFLWYGALYSIVAPLWLIRSVYNLITSKQTLWR